MQLRYQTSGSKKTASPQEDTNKLDDDDDDEVITHPLFQKNINEIIGIAKKENKYL